MPDGTDAKLEIVRAAFEDAMRKHYPIWSFASDGCGGYHNERTELAWQGWMACFLHLTRSNEAAGASRPAMQGLAAFLRAVAADETPDPARAHSAAVFLRWANEVDAAASVPGREGNHADQA